MGPLKNYSCRSTERTIKTFTNDVRSTTHPGVNSSNILTDRINLRQVGLQEALATEHEQSGPSNRPSAADSFLELPSDDPNAPQLWHPIGDAILLNDGEVMPGLSCSTFRNALSRYYQRSFSPQELTSLESTSIQLAGQFWSNSNVYSSKLYRDKKHLTAGADNYVLFEAGRFRR